MLYDACKRACIHRTSQVCEFALSLSPLILSLICRKGTDRSESQPLSMVLQASPSQLQCSTFKQSIVEQTVSLLNRWACTLAHSAAFPDVIFPTLVALRRMQKSMLVTHKAAVQTFVSRCQLQIDWCNKQQVNVPSGLTEAKQRMWLLESQFLRDLIVIFSSPCVCRPIHITAAS